MKKATVSAKYLNTQSSKLKGLMFENKIYPVYFETKYGVHTFFVRFPIDVLILDENNVVKIIKESLKPWHLYFWDPLYYRILELPAGFIKKSDIKIGIKIELNLTD